MSDLNLIASRLPGAQGTLSAVAITGTVSDPPRNLATLDNGTILRGTVQGRDKDGLTAVKTDQGLLKIATNANLPAGSNVTLEVRAIGDRLQVIVLAVDQGPHATDPAASAVSAGPTSPGSAQALIAETSTDGDVQAATHQSIPAATGTATSSTTSAPQIPSQPTVIVAGSSLTAIVIQSVPRDLIQSATAVLRQADDSELSAVSTTPTSASSDARAAFTADFRPTPTPPISASLMPAIHDRIAALFAEPVAGVEMIADAALSAVGGPAISADMRERIIALFVGEPANEPVAATTSQSAPNQPQQPGTGTPATATVQSQSAVSPGSVPASASPAANAAGAASSGAAAGQSIPAASLPAASPAQTGSPAQTFVPADGSAEKTVPLSAQVGTPPNGAVAGNPQPPLTLSATVPVPPSIEPDISTESPSTNQTPGAPPQPQQPSRPPAISLPNGNPGNQAAAGSRPLPPIPAAPPPPTGAATAGAPPSAIPIAGTSPGTPPPQPVIMPITPEVLAQLLADAAETGDMSGVPWQVPGAALPSAPPPQGSVPPAATVPASSSPLGATGLQAATLANLLVIIEQSSSASSPLTLSAFNSTLQDPAVSPSPIAPVSASPLPIASANPIDANASAQSNAKPASTAATALAALAESAAADALVDPKAEGIALTAIVTSAGKAVLTQTALGSTASGATVPDHATAGTPTSTAANGQVPGGTVSTNPAGSGSTGGSTTGAAVAGGATAGGTALANASAEYLATANAPTILAEDATGLTDLAAKGQLSGPLPTGTELRLRVLDIQQQPALNATIGPAQVNAAATGKATLIGQILGHTPAGHPVIHTSVGDLVLQQQASLPVGAKITLVLETIEMAGANNLMMPPTPPMTALNVSQGWPTLFDLLTTLQSGSTPAGLPGAPATSPDAGTIARLLQPGSSLAAGMADAIDAFRSGDFEKLFGALSTAVKAIGGKQDSVRKLRDEFGQLSTLAQDRSQQDWRCAFLPLWDDSRLQQINLFYRRPRRGEAGKNKDDDATRFIVEVNFTRLGGCQLDGLIRKKHFDLMIRSHQELPLEAKRHIAGLFAEARQLGNYAGDVSFQTSVRFPVSPLDDIAKDSPSITA